MKLKELKELRNKDLKELEKESETKRLEIVKTEAEMKGGKEKDLKKVKKIKRDLSQILTVRREKEFMLKEEVKVKEGKEEK